MVIVLGESGLERFKIRDEVAEMFLWEASEGGHIGLTTHEAFALDTFLREVGLAAASIGDGRAKIPFVVEESFGDGAVLLDDAIELISFLDGGIWADDGGEEVLWVAILIPS